jgi:hypothetical protein
MIATEQRHVPLDLWAQSPELRLYSQVTGRRGRLLPRSPPAILATFLALLRNPATSYNPFHADTPCQSAAAVAAGLDCGDRGFGGGAGCAG